MRGSTPLGLIHLACALYLVFLSITSVNVASGEAVQFDDPSQRTAVKEERLWRRSFPHVEVDHVPLSRLLGPLLEYRFLLPVDQLKAGVAYGGARRRLRHFVRALLNGHRVLKIGVVGGSISWGEGASNIGTTDWFSLLARWMIEAFPSSRITARNGAVPATPSSYMVMCLEQSVDPDVDLVLVEYSLNDGYADCIVDNDSTKPMERLLRRLLALPGKPAVIMMQVPMYGIAMEPDNPQHREFYFTNEDVDAALAHYYDVPYLSLRTALYRLAALDRVPGWSWREMFRDFHPGDAGSHVMADLVVHLLQVTAVELVMSYPWSADDAREPLRPLPPPMFPGNTSPDSPMCVVGEGFPPLVTESRGFTFLNEAGNTTNTATITTAITHSSSSSGAPPSVTQPRMKPKWGFVANWLHPETQPQPRLVVQLDTRRPAALVPPEAQVPLFVLHLRSYQHMGRAEISCVSGCSCTPILVDAHITEHVSQTYLARLNVTQAAVCEVAVTVLRETSSGQRKFKVSGVVVSETGGDVTVLERMSDTQGYWEVGRFHTGDLPMNEYGRANVDANGTAMDPRTAAVSSPPL